MNNDLYGEHKFLKIDMNDFKEWMESLPDFLFFHKEHGPTECYLTQKYSDQDFSVTPSTIYYSEKPKVIGRRYVEEQRIVNKVCSDTFQTCDEEIIIPGKWVNERTNPVSYYSETQKWVSSLEKCVCVDALNDEHLSVTLVKALFTKITGLKFDREME